MNFIQEQSKQFCNSLEQLRVPTEQESIQFCKDSGALIGEYIGIFLFNFLIPLVCFVVIKIHKSFSYLASLTPIVTIPNWKAAIESIFDESVSEQPMDVAIVKYKYEDTEELNSKEVGEDKYSQALNKYREQLSHKTEAELLENIEYADVLVLEQFTREEIVEWIARRNAHLVVDLFNIDSDTDACVSRKDQMDFMPSPELDEEEKAELMELSIEELRKMISEIYDLELEEDRVEFFSCYATKASLVNLILCSRVEETPEQEARREKEAEYLYKGANAYLDLAPLTLQNLVKLFLGLEGRFNWYELRQAYKQAANTLHPDKGGEAEVFTKMQSIYKFILKHYWKSMSEDCFSHI